MPSTTDWQFLLHASAKPVSAAAGSIWAIDVPTWITAIATAGTAAAFR
jgi:hypothetical protein